MLLCKKSFKFVQISYLFIVFKQFGMNKIDLIKEDYNIGDPIRIECRLGIKEGYIIDFTEDRIKLRPFEIDRKPISITEDSIGDFEEAVPPTKSINLTSENRSEQTLSIINTTDISEEKDLHTRKDYNQDFPEPKTICTVADVESINIIQKSESSSESNKEYDDNKTPKTGIKTEDIKLTTLGKIDLSRIPTTKKELKRRKDALSSSTQEIGIEPTELSTHKGENVDYEKVLENCKYQLNEILSSEKINLLETIPTNATVKKIKDLTSVFGTAVSDSGDIIIIQEEGFVGNPEILQNEGARLYCKPSIGESPKTCYVTISELTYKELNDFYEDSICNHMLVRAISIVKTLRSLVNFKETQSSLKSLYDILKKISRHFYRNTLVEIESPSIEEEERIAKYIKSCIENESSEHPLKDVQIRNTYAYKHRIKVPVDVISAIRERLGILSEEYRIKSNSFIQNSDNVLETINALNSRFDIDQNSLLDHLSYISAELEEVNENISVANAIIKKVTKNFCLISYNNDDLRCFYNSVLDFDLLERMSQNPNEEIPVRALTYLNKRKQEVKVSNIIADCRIQEHINKLFHLVEQGNYVYARRYNNNVKKLITAFLSKRGKKHLQCIAELLNKVSFDHSDLPIITINYSTKIQDELNASKNVALAIINEADRLIEQSDVDGAIHILDNIINQGILLPRENALMMQKKVQIFTSIERTDEAISVYLQWISYGINNKLFTVKKISRMYADLARIQSSIPGQETAALESLDKAIEYNPDNKLAVSFKEQMLEVVATKDQQLSNTLMVNPDVKSDHVIDVVSDMLVLDIQQHKFSDKRIINNGGVPNANIANELYQEAKQASEVDSYPLYLESAKAFHELKYYDQENYLYVVANYAKLKADSLLRTFRKLVITPSNNILITLYRLRDSAQSYYLESLNLWSYISFEDEEEEENNDAVVKIYDRIVLEILVNHLVLDVACHYAESEMVSTYNFNSLFNKTFKEVFFDCVKSKDDKLMRIAAGTIVKIGSYNSSTWNNLVSLPNGTRGLYTILGEMEIRKRLYDAINSIEKLSFPLDIKPNDLLQSAFSKHSSDRYEFEKMADKFREEVLSPHGMESITSRWKGLSPFYRLLSITDLETVSVIENIFQILKPYLHRSDDERSELLYQVTETIDEQIRFIDNNTTYYGRTYFYPLLNKWAGDIKNLRRERVASKHPRLSVTPDPAYILSDKGSKYVNLIIKNSGETTAEGFQIHLNLTSHSSNEVFSYTNSIITDIPSGQLAGLSVKINSGFDCSKGIDTWCGVSAIYQSRVLSELETKFTLEEEPSFSLDESDIVWSDGPITPKKLFFGRQELIDKFETHYLSSNRHKPYILYGLTRTGKSSIVKYLGEQITGKKIMINGETRTVLHFSMDLDDAAKCPNAKEVWSLFIRRCLYEKILEYSMIYPIDIEKCRPSSSPRSYELEDIMKALKECGYYPFITMDEFSHMKTLISSGRLTSAFLHTLRKDAFEGLASFMYIGTYDINDLLTNKQYGITGQLTHCISYQLNEIDKSAAKELMNILGDKLMFTEEAQELICKLSGCVPYFIQIICQNCGFYAIEHKRRFIGYPELIEVIKVLTGETELYDDESLIQRLTINAFEDNQYSASDPDYVLGLIASISYLTRDCDENNVPPHGIAIDELEKLWINYGISNAKYYIGEAIKILRSKKILHVNYNEVIPTYEIIVDLYRRWCKVEYPTIDLALTSMLKNN